MPPWSLQDYTGLSGIRFHSNQNGLSAPKENKNTICTMVKYGESFYGLKVTLPNKIQIQEKFLTALWTGFSTEE